MATAFVIDRYYLTITFLITLAWQCLGFFIAWTFQVSHLLNDIFGPCRLNLLWLNSLIRSQSA